MIHILNDRVTDRPINWHLASGINKNVNQLFELSASIPSRIVGVVLCPSSFQNRSPPQYTLASPIRNGSKLAVATKTTDIKMVVSLAQN